MQENSYARLSQSEAVTAPGEPEENGDETKKLPIRPYTYYDEGPFEAPSSESEEEEEALIEKNGMRLGGTTSPGEAEGGYTFREAKRRPTALRCLLISLASLLFMAIVIGFFAARTYNGTSFARVRGSRPLTMDHVFNGTFFAARSEVRWVPEAGDGVYANVDFHRGVIVLVDLKSNTTQDLVHLNDIQNESGDILGMNEWKLSPDMQYILLKTGYRKQWRHSSFGNYYIHDIAAKTTRPLIEPSQPSKTAYATWSPTGEAIAFVHGNDLYVLPNASANAIRLTDTGSETHFNGVPDWVYEEEVFSTDFALWWSQDAGALAFLELDETDVDVYEFPIYNPTNDAYSINPYTEEVRMRYPKPGYTNPTVNVLVFDLEGYLSDKSNADDEEDDEADTDEVPDGVEDRLFRLDWSPRQSGGESIIFDVTWVGPDDLIVKEVNRAADDGAVIHFDTRVFSSGSGSLSGTIVRRLGKNGEEGDDGWIESRQSILPIPPSLAGSLALGESAYLDFVNNTDGYTHIALFSPATSGTPIFISNDSWEVVDSILGIDANGIVYFAAAYPISTQRTIFAAPIPAQPGSTLESAEERLSELTALTDTSIPAWYEAAFSPEAGYYVLSYRGPNVPWQSILKVGETPDEFEFKLTDNARLNATLAEYQSPLIVHSTIENDGYELNAMELLPPNFDDSGRTKYPVLFRVYGGPGSQMVHTRFERDWHAYLACALKYVIVIVDGRGTGFKGRRLRNPVRGNLGYWETKDMVEAARIWASKKYVDPKRVGIWGWSYGGFMSAKVVEANAGIHTLAMSVAPVTAWELYDSIYTERYMSTPQLNPSGYHNASIHIPDGFSPSLPSHSLSSSSSSSGSSSSDSQPKPKSNVNFLLAHGSGDDNVHFAHSARLLDLFTAWHAFRGPSSSSSNPNGIGNGNNGNGGGGGGEFRFRMFTDSDHSISRRGAYRELHEWMTGFLLEKWGKGGRRRTW